MKRGLFFRKVFVPGIALAFMLSALIVGCGSSGGNEAKQLGSVSGKEVQDDAAGVEAQKKDEGQSAADVQETDSREPEVTAGNDGAVNTGSETGENKTAQTKEDVGVQTDAKTKEGTGKAKTRMSAEITSQPANVYVVEGDTALFRIGARGDGLTYQWQCRESADRSWRKSLSPGADSGSLQIEGRKEYNSFQFRCVISDDRGGSVASEAVSLSVLAITKQATGENIKKGHSASFIVKATGRDLSYEWERMKPSENEWKKYGSDNTDSTLKIKDASTGWNGCKYRCKITDPGGNTVYSDPVTLYVLGISSDPEDKSLRSGGWGSFRVIATGKNIKYRWQYRKQTDDKWKEYAASPGSESVLKITDAGLGLDGADFRCKITDADGKKVYSSSAKLYVFGIRADPSSKYVKKGGNTVFKVLAGGRNLKYQWQKKKKGTSSWSNASGDGNQSATLKIQNAAASYHGMVFRCKVTDAEGKTAYSKAAGLYVLAITGNPSSKNVQSDSTAVFKVKAQGAGLKYNWQVKESSSDEWRSSLSSGHGSSVLKVKTGKGRNGFRFRCKVTDAGGNAAYSDTAVLYVPGILKNPTTQRVKAGTTAVFRVKAGGYKLKYSWQVRESSYDSWRNSTSSGHTTNTLKISAKSAYHGYQFRCRITDGDGLVFHSKTAVLSVLSIRTQPYDQSVDTGHTAVFRVSASGSGLRFQWQVKENSGGWRNSASSGNHTSVLKVPANMGRDGFQFRCRVRDSKGNTVYSEPAYLWVFNSEELFFDTYE